MCVSVHIIQIERLIDLNGMLTRVGLFYAEKFDNQVNY